MYGVTRMDTCEAIALMSFKRIPLDPEVLADIFRQFSDSGINIDMISQTAPTGHHVSISFTCLDSDMVKVLGISKALSGKYPDIKPMVSSGNCKIQLFGEEMRNEPGVFARALECLCVSGLELRQITTSEVDISLLVSADQAEEAAAKLKDAFGL